MNTEEGCPHCGNQFGFAFGMCCECGFNHLSNKFDFIKVYTQNLGEDQSHLIQQHADATRKRN